MTRSVRSRVPAAYVLAVLTLPLTAQVVRLSEVWRTNLGPANEGAFYRSAVCPDGTVFIAGSGGRLWAVATDGRIIDDRGGLAGLQPVSALACSNDGELVAANLSGLTKFRLGPQGTRVVSTAQYSKPLAPFRLLVSPERNNEYFILGLDPSGGGVLYRISEDGTVLSGFERPADAPSSWASQKSEVNGSILWDSETHELLVIPENPYEIRRYRADGTLMAVDRSISGIRPTRVDPWHQRPLPGDRVRCATLLPDGSRVVQIIRQTMMDSGTLVAEAAYLEILDRHGNTRATNVAVAGYGKLIGADGKGVLYFSAITSEGGVNIVKATLEGMVR